MLDESSNEKSKDVDNPAKILLENNRAKDFLEPPRDKTPMAEGCMDLTKGLLEWSPIVQGVGISFKTDSAKMKQESLEKGTDVVKVFDERLKTKGGDVRTMEYSNKNCNHFSIAYEGHRTFQFKQSKSIIEGTERGGIDVELKEVTQMSNRISPINIQNSKFSKLSYDPRGTCFFVEQSTTEIGNAASSVVKSACSHAKVERAKVTSMSVKGPFLEDISIRIHPKKLNLVVLLLEDSFVEEHKGLCAIYFPFSVLCSSLNTENSPLPLNSEENEHAWDASLCPSGKVSPHSSIVNIKAVTTMGIVNRYASTYKNDDSNSVYESSKFITRMDITKLKIMVSSTGVLTISVHVHVDQSREDHSMKFEQENSGFMKHFEGLWRMKLVFVDEEACYPFKPTTLHQVLDPMFLYFDSGHHWISQHGLAMKILSNMSYWKAARNQQLILVAVVYHLEHKNVTPRLENKWWFSGNIKFTRPMLHLHKERVIFCDFLSLTPKEQATHNAAVNSIFDAINHSNFFKLPTRLKLQGFN
ncbi:hypothetical protein V6N11_050180 [Hibiscus sabdariffa]|uniref:DUF220 domain-containing protein n=1 Tax=Hibiscus sabdariffa TaxID=183260 RepID=A0ABR2T922_9ROSI